MAPAIKRINPITDVTVEHGKINLVTKNFRYEKTLQSVKLDYILNHLQHQHLEKSNSILNVVGEKLHL